MTRTRLLFLALTIATISACGGRSPLKAVRDGGPETGAAVDGQRDTLFAADGPRTADAPADALTRDVANVDAFDGRASDGSAPDGSASDARDVNTTADLRPDGGTDGRLDVVTREALSGEAGGDAAPTLTSIEIAPPSLSIAVGVPYGGFVITAVFSDGSTADVTTQTTLTSGDATIVQISGRTLTGLKAGLTTVKAAYSGLAATASVSVTASPLQSISIDGVAPVSVGQSILITATGVFADGTRQDITAAATWTSSATTLATLALDSASGKEKVTGVLAGTLSVTATLSGITGKAAITVTAAAMTSIAITPAQPIMQQGVSRNFQATASYADGTTGDVTLQATWASSSTATATVTSSSTGVVVKAIAAGTTTISATVGTVRGSTTVTVTSPTLASIGLVPATWSPNVGSVQAFIATGTYSDGSTADVTISATWSSSNGATVSVSNAAGGKGQATALAVGSAQIQATLSGVTGSAAVTVTASPLVSIAVTPNTLAVVLGLKGSLVATGTYQNGTTQVLTTQVAWAVSDPSIATVSNGASTAGQVTGVGVGSTTVTATLTGISSKALVNVAQAKLTAITVTPATVSVTAGVSQQFKATGSYDNGSTPDLTTQVTWTSSDITVAQISNAAGSNGLAASLVGGTSTITATFGGLSGTATLTVGDPLLSSIMIAPTSASIQVGDTQAFTVTAVYQNGTTAAVPGTWTSSDTAVATIVAAGGGGGGGGGGRRAVATGVAAGTTTITVTYQGLSASAKLTVTAVTTLVGLTITPANPAGILVGANQQFQANAVFSDGSTNAVTAAATWTTSDATVASVSNGGGGPGGGGLAGRVTGVGAGSVTITATYNGLTASVALTVRNPVLTGLLITPETASVKVNGTQQFIALATFEDGTTATVTNAASWTTSDGAIASIRSAGGGGGGGGGGRGLATGIAAGTVTVTATYDGFSATATLTVSAATVSSLVVTPAAASIQVGQAQALVATLVYSDGTTAVVTGTATWSSSDASVATVTTAGGGGGGGGGGGNATGIGVGTATITASYSGLTGSATLTVSDPPLAFVQVTPTNPSIPVQATVQFTATAVFTDNSTRNVTALATWSSSSSTVAVVNNSGGTIGRATALAEGTTTITASYQGMSGSTLLTVAGSVQSISVTPANPTSVLGLPVTFTATAVLSNGTTMVVTGAASWVSSDASVATVTASGVATPVKAGSATITATYLGKSGTSVLTVSVATLSSITVTPNPVPMSLAAAKSQQLVATGTYSDLVARDLTNVATWLSSTAAVATVSNANGSRGLLTAIASGATTVTAVFQGITSAPDTVTVGP